MKKLLLTLAAAAVATGMYADDVVFNMAELSESEITGPYTETTYNDKGSVQAYGHYQPIEQIARDGWTLTFAKNAEDATEPALYDTKDKAHSSLRLYFKNGQGGNTMTVTAPGGESFKTVVLKAEGSDYYSVPTASEGTIGGNKTDLLITWTSEEPVYSVTFEMNKLSRFTEITISTEAGEIPDVPEPGAGLSADFANGQCNFTWEDGTLPEGLNYVWTYASSYKYMKASAYVSGTSYAVDGAYLVSPEFTLEGLSQATLKVNEAYGPAAYTATQANEAFSVCVRENGGAWQEVGHVTFPADTQKWTFVDNTYDLSAFDGKAGLQLGFKYTSTSEASVTWEIKSVNVTGNVSGVATIATENGAAQYYNLQGVRVANPERGLYIKVQNGKASKVML